MCFGFVCLRSADTTTVSFQGGLVRQLRGDAAGNVRKKNKSIHTTTLKAQTNQKQAKSFTRREHALQYTPSIVLVGSSFASVAECSREFREFLYEQETRPAY